MKNIILVDADGVLLNWEFAFDVWMQEHGHKIVPGNEKKYSIGKRYGIDDSVGRKLVKIFNESAAVGFLPPLRDAMYYVKKLHEEHGYIFRCITSLSLDKNAGKLRRMNLEKLFGPTVFDDIVCLDTGADKDSALEQYRDSGYWWIEDKIENAEVGLRLGLRPILVEHGHNMSYTGPIPLVKDWAQIHRIITST